MLFLAGIGSLGPLEIVLLLSIVIIVFGVGKLPEVGGALGKAVREFRSSVKEESKEDEPETPRHELPETTDQTRRP